MAVRGAGGGGVRDGHGPPDAGGGGVRQANTGALLSDGTWTYKIPTAACIPRRLNVTFLKVGVAYLHIMYCDLTYPAWIDLY